ncbi:cbb3-type cytochrome oxidase assembly protein CcoS [Ningiella sp. W23]|uniref:cbb3-type cytochrome oxidase assembly protein CcoS n=1 Tax=Ningiella sp. W23 TaxID=3023715 RepID=UPI0037574003
MSIIFVLIPLAIIIVSIAIGVFFWAVKSNQFDDLERQGYSILFDDDIKQDDKANPTKCESIAFSSDECSDESQKDSLTENHKEI